MKRKYELKERARRQAETRQRIVDATLDLHTSVGPARTTISAVAKRAGVERHTVYAHFPDEGVLFSACSAHWIATHPAPDFAALAAVEDPVERLRRSVDEIYAWYESVEPDLALFHRDASLMTVGVEVMVEFGMQWVKLADAIARGWPRRKIVRSVIGHALDFETWRSLVRREGLSRKQAVDAMVQLVSCV
jgi:AcrR family transcriptional regulator